MLTPMGELTRGAHSRIAVLAAVWHIGEHAGKALNDAAVDFGATNLRVWVDGDCAGHD